MNLNVDRRTIMAGLLATTGLGVAAPVVAAATSAESAKARALYDRLFAQLLQANPELATDLGLDTGDKAGLRAHLTSEAPGNRFYFAPTFAAAREELAAIDASKLSPVEATWLGLARWSAERSAEIIGTPYGGFGGYPIPYTLTQLTGSYQSVPDFLDSRHPVESKADAEAWLSRMSEMATNINYEVDRSRIEAKMGVVPPTFILAKALAQTKALRAETGAASGMAANLAKKAKASNVEGDWSGRAAALVDGPIAAALDRQIALFEELMPRSTIAPGASRLPGGAAFYAMCLRYHTSTSLTPQQAHQRGLDEVRSYQARLEPLLKAQGLTTGTVGARLTALGKRPDQLYPNTDAGRAELLVFANKRNDAMRPLLPRIFNNPPAATLEIRRVPPAIELGAPRGYAQSGSLDGKRPGAFYINLRDTAIWPRFSLPTLVYHEGIPGHVYQGAVLLGQGEIPLLHRTLGIAAYGEGWGLYAEQLADELGVYADEPLGRIGYLQAALYRAVRVVVDTGMHALGWSKARALQYMIDITGLAPSAAENEIDRYIVWPGQATSYKLGHSEIVAAREAARKTMGERFDIRAFHDLVLNNGAQPLDLLRRNVDAWARRA